MAIFDPGKLLLIAGPCSLENEEVCRPVAEKLAALQEEEPDLTIIFKGSCDKANRTSLDSPRGPGFEEGLVLLAAMKKDYGLPVITDVHAVDQVAAAGWVCDVLQIPAFLCRQTDLLVAAAQSGRIVNVKKGQFLSPPEMRFVVEKAIQSGASEVWQTERGTTFGYQNLVVDMRSFSIMKRHSRPVIFDATHGVQLPGAGGGKSGGEREFVPPLARAALAAGADGLFIETHPDPSTAISDGPSQIPIDELPALIKGCLRVWKAAQS